MFWPKESKKGIYLGLFMISLASLMYEILLVRVFSVTLWYHFAFMAVSIAMFGMTLGAMIVYLFPGFFNKRAAQKHLVFSSIIFAVSLVASFLVYLKIPLTAPASSPGFSFNFFSLGLIYTIVAIPFVFSGIAVCLALTKFPQKVSSLYAADLIGACAGCILLIYLLNLVSGPIAITIIAVLAAIGAWFFVWETGEKRTSLFVLVSGLALILFAGLNIFWAQKGRPLLKLTWVKGGQEKGTIYEKWNSFSRITVWGDENSLVAPFGWGLSPYYPVDKKIRQLWMFIDAAAGTPLTFFSGDLDQIEFLKYDLVNLVHYLRPNSKVFIVGTGGGRDVLSALLFEQKSIVGVEVNKDIIEAVNKRFGYFTGHLDQNPEVVFVADEARSYLAASQEKFDIIQVSLIDTWAATAAGAFVLTENSLYTVEAFRTFLEHLNPNGVLTLSRWYFRDRPGEVYRLTALASASLSQLGIENPREHIIIAKRMGEQGQEEGPDGIGTILLSKDPFSEKDLVVVKEVIEKMGFELVLSPDFSLDPVFADLAPRQDFEKTVAGFPINIAPPTDDKPFFFHLLRLKDVFNPQLWQQGKMSFNMRAIVVLGLLLVIVSFLTLFFIVFPLVLKSREGLSKKTLPFVVYFAAIGLGFMLVEISLMQRLIIFLGHPVYSLSVLLFSLLLASGLGSYLTKKIEPGQEKRATIMRLLLLLLVLIIFARFTPLVIQVFEGSNRLIRIVVAGISLFGLGIFMGMAFPLGMRLASKHSQKITPFLWGINGATSVLASVLAVAISLNWGISAAFWLGFWSYFLALLSFSQV